MPCAVFITGELPLKIPGVTFFLLYRTPFSCHTKQDRRYHILAGGTRHIVNLLLSALSQQVRTGAHDKASVQHREAATPPDLFFCLLPGLKKFLRRDGSELLQGFAPRTFHYRLPEGEILFCRGCRKHLADTAPAGHNGPLKQTAGKGAQTMLLNAHGTGTLSHDSDVFRVSAKSAGLIGAGSVSSSIVNALPLGNLSGILPSSGSGTANALIGDRSCHPSGSAPQPSAGSRYNFTGISDATAK